MTITPTYAAVLHGTFKKRAATKHQLSTGWGRKLEFKCTRGLVASQRRQMMISASALLDTYMLIDVRKNHQKDAPLDITPISLLRGAAFW